MLRIAALVQVIVLLAACAPKPSYIPGIYVSVDYSVDAPNPTVPRIPRYFDVLDSQHVVVYYPVRIKAPKAPRHEASFVWSAESWSIERIPDRSSGIDDLAQCCHYRSSVGGASKGRLWLFHFPTGDNLAWFPPDYSRSRRRDYLHVTRPLPRVGSPYSFTRAPLNISV